MTAAVLGIVIAGVIVGMAATLRRRKLPAEPVILLSVLESLQTSPQTAAPPKDPRSA
jgi:hypothetical protein